jgi:hypothetical protein
MGGVGFDIFVYSVYLMGDGCMFNCAVVVYDQDVVKVSGVVSYVFCIKYMFN